MNRIGDYALIGNCYSAALVGRDGSIDWACFPRFDSPAVFCRVLDEEKGGSFSVRPEGVRATARAYMESTNVLVTKFECESGELELTDCMPVGRLDASDPTHVEPDHAILRRLRCVSGEVAVGIRIHPRFEYGLFAPRCIVTSSTTAEVVGGSDSLFIAATAALEPGTEAIRARWTLRAAQEIWLYVAWAPSLPAREFKAPDPDVYAKALEDTVQFWREWLSKCWYEGEHTEIVQRSALALKALTYAPTGAVVAAPTTSLPEEIGGERNWDYRYTWIRDATLTLISLFILGFREEADAFKTWLERTGAGRPQDLQIMYGICGERSLPERTLSHLAGHRGSGPVRIGNGAVDQMQLDCYGQLLEAAYLYGKAGGSLTAQNLNFLLGVVEIIRERWRKPDHGIWEVRDTPRHFTHSKLNCWVGLARAVQVGEMLGMSAPLAAWAAERDAIRDFVINESAPKGWIQQASDSAVPDASALLVPAMGLLPTQHPVVSDTIDVVLKELTQDGLVYRYLADDGLEGGEGAFLLCSFWLLDCLTHAGRLDEADELLERLLGLANDVGLYSEEADVNSGEALGNFPQAFTHMALVSSCAHLSAAKQGLVPYEGAHDYSELALDRLLARSQAGRDAGH
ncbi:MAG TPA: glycoside hydrolase family 15 protein [Actinomycetota bacterium]|nr:glycoside hydrolase family 15 protein [Actinomycetota bacterium]